MSTSAQRHGYVKIQSAGYIEDLDENGFPVDESPSREYLIAWARSHGKPEFPNTSPLYFDLSDRERRAASAHHKFFRHIELVRFYVMSGDRQKAAYHLNRVSESRKFYEFNRKG